MTPHTQAPPQRRPSAPIVGQTSGPATFHPLVTTHPQAAAYHAMSPISPMDQFHQPQQNQAGFYSPSMMHMNMQQQPQQPPPSMMQPSNQQMVFNGYSMESGNVPGGQHMMNGVQGWSGPGGQPMANQPGGNTMMAQPQHGHGRPVPNGMNHEGWFMPFDMQAPEGAPNMTMAQGHPEGYNGMYAPNGMPVQNPPGGLRHAQ